LLPSNGFLSARILAPSRKQRFSIWQKNCFCWAPWAFLSPGTRDVSPRKRQALAAAAGLLVGLVLEAGQIALQSRNPSLTDVLLFGGAAWAGAVVFGRYRRIRDVRVEF
jgi:hypothetical protein